MRTSERYYDELHKKQMHQNILILSYMRNCKKQNKKIDINIVETLWKSAFKTFLQMKGIKDSKEMQRIYDLRNVVPFHYSDDPYESFYWDLLYCSDRMGYDRLLRLNQEFFNYKESLQKGE